MTYTFSERHLAPATCHSHSLHPERSHRRKLEAEWFQQGR